MRLRLSPPDVYKRQPSDRRAVPTLVRQRQHGLGCDGGRGHAELFQRQRGLIERQKSVVAGQHIGSFVLIVRTYSYAITGDLYLRCV